MLVNVAPHLSGYPSPGLGGFAGAAEVHVDEVRIFSETFCFLNAPELASLIKKRPFDDLSDADFADFAGFADFTDFDEFGDFDLERL